MADDLPARLGSKPMGWGLSIKGGPVYYLREELVAVYQGTAIKGGMVHGNYSFDGR